MASYFYECVNEVVSLEGGYVNDPKDPGGETNMGITKNTAVRYGYMGEMKTLTKEQAMEIYKRGFWDVNSLDLIENRDLQFEIFDSGVNCGPSVPASWLQEILNSLNQNQTRWRDVSVDGVIGPMTASIVNGFCRDANMAKMLFNMMNAYQTVHYIKCCTANKDLEKYMYGWMANRVRFKA